MDEIIKIENVRKNFSFCKREIYGRPLIYFDNAATTQKPQCVIDEMVEYYSDNCSGVNRSIHYLSEIATNKYNKARFTIRAFLNASNHEIIFTRSATESINLVCHGLSKIHFTPGDEIILTEMEHHSNIVPWYLTAKELGLNLKVIPLLKEGILDIDTYIKLFNKKTKLVSFTHASNAIGIVNPIKKMVKIAKSFGVPTLIDGAQSTPHIKIDLTSIDCDFFVFSGHKVYGPTGIGVLAAKKEWLEKMPPWQGGGDMIASVSFDEIIFANPPNKFEAGTPHIAGALGLSKAIDYIEELNKQDLLHKYEMDLHNYALDKISAVPKLTVVGKTGEKIPLISFFVEGVHPHDLASIMDREGIALRAGHLCAEPLMKKFGVSSLVRASFAFYNTKEEIDQFIKAFDKVFEVFKL